MDFDRNAPLSFLVDALVESATAMPQGKPKDLSLWERHYSPEPLKPWLGYDQRVAWQALVEFGWLINLSNQEVMPSAHRELITEDLFRGFVQNITTTDVTWFERNGGGHDILALLNRMKSLMPVELHRWLHVALTSYDVVLTAYALQLRETFRRVFIPLILEIDSLWKQRIIETKETVQIGRTHLQHATPITIGMWLTVLHSRFVNSVTETNRRSGKILGKFSGPVGTGAALRVLFPGKKLERTGLSLLELPRPRPSTQLTQLEPLVWFMEGMYSISRALSNLGDDVRHLQGSDIGEVTTESSTSSAMSHKDSNPIAAENVDGMSVSALCELLKVELSINSTLQRDLRYSNVMRGYGALLAFTYQQLLTTRRVLKSFSVNKKRLMENFNRNGKWVVAELLHLYLQTEGYPDAHTFVNKKIVPAAKAADRELFVEMDAYLLSNDDPLLQEIWDWAPTHVKRYLWHPEDYIGHSVEMAEEEAAIELSL